MKSLLLVSPLAALPCLLYAEPARVSVVGDWQVHIEAGVIALGERRVTLAAPVTLDVPPAVVVAVRDEAYAKLPLFNPKTGGWVRGAQLRGVKCQECTARFQLEPASFHLKKAAGQADEWQRGVDYEVDLEWGTFGRLAGGALTPDATVSSTITVSRADCIVVWADGSVASWARRTLPTLLPTALGSCRSATSTPRRARPSRPRTALPGSRVSLPRSAHRALTPVERFCQRR